jgi:hypothetical protein
MSTFHLDDSSATFEVYYSKDKARWRVRVADSDESPLWDYEDCDTARALSAEIRGCTSYEDCAAALGLGGY